MLMILLACSKPGDTGAATTATTATTPVDRPDAIVASDRSGHWLDRPWPSDEDPTADGMVDWAVLPEAPTDLGQTMAGGWAAQAALTVQGASHQPAIYFRFEETFDLTAADVGLVASDGTEVPVEWSWIEDPAGDPWLAEDLLIVMPEPTSPLRSGERYVAWVSDTVADPAEGWTAPDGTPDGAAVSTAFTVQDSLGQLRALVDAVDTAISEHPEYLVSDEWREVASLEYAQGETPSGNATTVATVTYADGQTAVTYLGPKEDAATFALVLDETWPFQVFEGHITTLAFQDLTGQPWASPGIGLLTDFSRRDDGWLHFDGATLLDTGAAEQMRVVVQIPRTGAGPFPVLTWDHGTGGHAYNAVGRSLGDDEHAEVAAALSGAVIVSRDQPLYGTRYPLIDEGFGSSLGFYNIGNLPCFRDNQRQAVADHRVMLHFVRDQLPSLADVDTDRVGAFGHSLGSVTAHGAQVAQGADGQKAALMSGTGGYFTYYILETGLLGTGHSLVEQIGPLLGIDSETLADASPAELIAAIVGLPETAWGNMDRRHPVLQVFQSIMDPSDPLMLVADSTVPDTILLGLDDFQVPNGTTEWLSEVHPDATVIECERSYEYDGHWCTFREPAAFDAFSSFVSSL